MDAIQKVRNFLLVFIDLLPLVKLLLQLRQQERHPEKTSEVDLQIEEALWPSVLPLVVVEKEHCLAPCTQEPLIALPRLPDKPQIFGQTVATCSPIPLKCLLIAIQNNVRRETYPVITMNELGVRCIDVRDLGFVFDGGIKLLKRTEELVRINQPHDFPLLIRDRRLVVENQLDWLNPSEFVVPKIDFIVARHHNKGGAGELRSLPQADIQPISQRLNDALDYTLNRNSTTFRNRKTFGSTLSIGGNVTTQRLGQRRQMSLDDIADHVDVDSEVLVHQDVAKTPNLRPGDLRV